jgi:hypothetical protein
MNWYVLLFGCVYTVSASATALILGHQWNMSDAIFHLIALSLILAWWQP